MKSTTDWQRWLSNRCLEKKNNGKNGLLNRCNRSSNRFGKRSKNEWRLSRSFATESEKSERKSGPPTENFACETGTWLTFDICAHRREVGFQKQDTLEDAWNVAKTMYNRFGVQKSAYLAGLSGKWEKSFRARNVQQTRRLRIDKRRNKFKMHICGRTFIPDRTNTLCEHLMGIWLAFTGRTTNELCSDHRICQLWSCIVDCQSNWLFSTMNSCKEKSSAWNSSSSSSSSSSMLCPFLHHWYIIALYLPSISATSLSTFVHHYEIDTGTLNIDWWFTAKQYVYRLVELCPQFHPCIRQTMSRHTQILKYEMVEEKTINCKSKSSRRKLLIVAAQSWFLSTRCSLVSCQSINHLDCPLFNIQSIVSMPTLLPFN